jgi:hypothetical protein
MHACHLKALLSFLLRRRRADSVDTSRTTPFVLLVPHAPYYSFFSNIW